MIAKVQGFNGQISHGTKIIIMKGKFIFHIPIVSINDNVNVPIVIVNSKQCFQTNFSIVFIIHIKK